MSISELFKQFSSARVKFLMCEKFFFANFMFWFFRGRQISVTKACNLISSSAVFDTTTNLTTSKILVFVFSPKVFNATSFLALILGFKKCFHFRANITKLGTTIK